MQISPSRSTRFEQGVLKNLHDMVWGAKILHDMGRGAKILHDYLILL